MKKVLYWIFSVVIVGILVSLIGNRFYYNVFQAPELSYTTRTYSIFSGVKTQKDKITLTLNDKPLSKLYMTTIRLENTGGTTLTRYDFSAEKDPLRIHGDDIKSIFIDTSNSNFNSETQLLEKDGDFYIQFKWLNPDDYITINVLHDNLKSEIKLYGSFEQIKSLNQISFNAITNRKIFINAILIATIITVCISSIMLLIMIILNKILYGIYWFSLEELSIYAFIISSNMYTKKEKKRIFKEIVAAKTKEGRKKILDYYLKQKE